MHTSGSPGPLRALWLRAAARVGAATDWFLLPDTLQSPEETRRARLGVAIAWVTALLSIAAAAGQLLAGNRRGMTLDLALASLTVAAPFVAKRLGLRPVAHGMLALAFCAFLAMSIWFRGAGLTPSSLCLALIPFFATLLISTRAGAGWAVASLLGESVIAVLGHAGLVADHLPVDKRLVNDHIALAIVTLLLFWLSLLYERRKEVAMSNLAALEEQRRIAELERVRALNEVQLARNERLASLGRIAAATAHEINNPLTYVSLNLQSIAESQLIDAQVRAQAREALDGATRIQRIVSDMLLCARPGDNEIGSADLFSAITMAMKLAEPTTRARARVRTHLGPLPEVSGSESRLVQVFLNLLVNAAQAMPEGHATEHEIAIESRVLGDRVNVEVRDNGRGIPVEIIHQVKEPFFTTKPVGEGTGLGLTLCDGIVRSFGGTLTLDSRPGCTTVVVSLRISDAASPQAEPLPPAQSATPGQMPLRVLIIDDEQQVAQVLARLLDAQAVTTLYSGREALALLATGRRFDLILCDLMMPDLSGMDLYEQLRVSDRAAAEAIVFMSGGTFTERAREFRASVANIFLDKPIALTTLRALVAVHAPAVARTRSASSR
jgi:signal transduction histidine kinase/ActR/RegA family two-component response regulator